MKKLVKKHLMKMLIPMPYSIRQTAFMIWGLTTKAGRITDKGERFVVSSWDEAIESGEFHNLYFAHHYWFVSKQIPKGSKVLDLGCGSGYGTWYLAHVGNHVLGIDVDAKTIDWAKKHFKNNNLSFKLYSPLNHNYGVSIYDSVVCFEVLEHVKEQQSLIQGIYRSLKPNSELIISTPNITKTGVRTKLLEERKTTMNPGHVKEISIKEIEELLKQYFQHVELYGHCLKGVNDFDTWKKWHRKNNIKLTDFELRKDFVNCEIIVARCKK